MVVTRWRWLLVTVAAVVGKALLSAGRNALPADAGGGGGHHRETVAAVPAPSGSECATV